MKIFVRVAVLLLSLILIFFLNNFLFLDMFNESAMYGSYIHKKARAESIDTEKVIIIGGSSSNLGFDSELFEELSGKPAVNLAVAADVPLRVYMKAAESSANEGDTIIMPLEYTFYSRDFYIISEVYVDMVCMDSELKCQDSLIGNIDFATCMFLRSFTKFNDCLLFMIRGISSSMSTIYIADSVNEFGDFCLHEGKTATYVSTAKDEKFAYDPVVFEEIQSFIDRMKEKGVDVYLSYPATDRYRYEEYEEYFSCVQTVIESFIPKENILGTPIDFAYDSSYFYDTVYHLKYEYRGEHTEKLYTCYAEKAE